MDFYRWCNEEATSLMCSELRFAVFGLGNTQYEHFGFMGKWAHERLAALGGTPICDVAIGDDDDDIRSDFEKWVATLWAALGVEDAADDSDPVASFECRLLKT